MRVWNQFANITTSKNSGGQTSNCSLRLWLTQEPELICVRSNTAVTVYPVLSTKGKKFGVRRLLHGILLSHSQTSMWPLMKRLFYQQRCQKEILIAGAGCKVKMVGRTGGNSKCRNALPDRLTVSKPRGSYANTFWLISDSAHQRLCEARFTRHAGNAIGAVPVPFRGPSPSVIVRCTAAASIACASRHHVDQATSS